MTHALVWRGNQDTNTWRRKTTWRHRGQTTVHRPRRGNQPHRHLDLGLPPSRTLESKFSCVSDPVYGTLIWQPQWTNTMPIWMCLKNIRLDKIANHRTLTVWFHLGKKKKKDICSLGIQAHTDTYTPNSYILTLLWKMELNFPLPEYGLQSMACI